MPASPIHRTIHHLRRAALAGAGVHLTDAQLLTSFVEHQDPLAFATLVRRHGPMILGVCRRLLRNHHDAEDAFQATFLVLVRKARSVVPRAQVGNWLYGVARTTALRARAAAAKRRMRERQAANVPELMAGQPDGGSDLRLLLDEELNRLPDKYRTAVILCDLEGKTRKEAAQQVGWPEGTLSSRLARARQMLAKRLARRGLVRSGGSLAMVLAEQLASASVPAALVGATVQAAELTAAGQAATGAVSAHVATLMEGVLSTMWMTKWKTMATVLVLLSAIAAVGGVLSRQLPAGQPVVAQPHDPGSAKREPVLSRENLEKEELQGTWFYLAFERGGEFRSQAEVERLGPKPFVRMTFSPHESVWEMKAGKGEGEVIKLDYSLRVAGRRNLIEFRPKPGTKGQPVRCAYSIDGDELKVTFLTEELDNGRLVAHHYFMRQAAVGVTPRAPGTSDKDHFQGAWSVVSVERGGKPDAVEKAVLLVDGNRACWQTSDGEMHGGLYLDPTGRPKAYDFVTSERTFEGIYVLEGDTLLLCYDPMSEAKRPRQVSTTKKGQLVLIVLKRLPGVEVHNYRRPDGSKTFPTLIEKAGQPVQPPPYIAATPPPPSQPPQTAPPPRKLGQIWVVGNTKTATAVILQKLAFRPGQFLDYPSLQAAERRLAAFNARITMIDHPDRPAAKDLLVTVEEK